MRAGTMLHVCASSASILALSIGMAVGASVPIASTSFEAAEGYVAGNNVRTQPGNSFPMPDGPGWGNNNWAGEGTSSSGVIFMPVVNDPATARSGSQYFVIHGDRAPSTGDIRIRRKYDTSLIQDNRVAFGTSVRLDTDQAAYDANSNRWFASHFNLYLEYGTSSPNPNEGRQNLRIEFARDSGNVNLKVGGSNVVLGQWTDSGGPVFAKDAWLDVMFDVDIANSTFDLFMNGAHMGNHAFNVTLRDGETLNQIRFQGARAYTGYLNTGASIDDVWLSTVPEPASVLMVLLAGGALMRRPTRSRR